MDFSDEVRRTRIFSHFAQHCSKDVTTRDFSKCCGQNVKDQPSEVAHICEIIASSSYSMFISFFVKFILSFLVKNSFLLKSCYPLKCNTLGLFHFLVKCNLQPHNTLYLKDMMHVYL